MKPFKPRKFSKLRSKIDIIRYSHNTATYPSRKCSAEQKPFKHADTQSAAYLTVGT